MEENMKQSMSRQRPSSLLFGAVLGALTSLPVIALSYLGAKLAGLPFFPFDLFDWLARVLPGNVITLGIDSMVSFIRLIGIGPISSTAKSLEQTAGIVLVIAGGAVLGLITALGLRYGRWSGGQVGAVLAIVAFLAVLAVEFSLGGITSFGSLATLWLAILIVSWGRLLGGWIDSLERTPAPPVESEEYRLTRRALLIKLAAGSIGIAVVAVGLGRWLELRQQASGAGQALSNLVTPTPAEGSLPSGAPTIGTSSTPLASGTLQATRDLVAPVPGTRPELTSNKDFYRIDIDTLPQVLDKSSWKLQVTGLFDRPRALTLDDLLAYPPVTQSITQGCISNPVGGDLISTTNYTGVRLRDLLKDLGMRPETRELAIQAADGFYESVVMQDLMDPRTLLVYGMNGETLPVEHGFPLRIYIPNRYGMKQPKWITVIEAIDHEGPGYWVKRGWSATAYPQIVSVIDAVAKDRIENGRVPVGGIAWAGDRGIQKVQVQVDDGDWTDAVLRTPALSPLTWVQWRYDWPVVRGTHRFRVRAMDGTGAMQIAQPADTYPDGATGYHSLTVSI